MPTVISDKINEMAKDRMFYIRRDRLITSQMKGDDYKMFSETPLLNLPEPGTMASAYAGHAFCAGSKKRCSISINIRNNEHTDNIYQMTTLICCGQQRIFEDWTKFPDEEFLIPGLLVMIDMLLETFAEESASCNKCGTFMMRGPCGTACEDNDLICKKCVFRF